MAGRLTAMGSRVLGGHGAAARAATSALRHRAGMGLPAGRHIVPDKPLPTNDELVWDNGTPFPEQGRRAQFCRPANPPAITAGAAAARVPIRWSLSRSRKTDSR
ncbi:hypothetical protein BRADI_2g34775v3 [Brachypodium distachyon]|uniref:Uncharacterized protein n=1 Tax=Brachypodium distachyon TaxID=15368 RepID=A0A2K2DBR6_BRADI|nr:hypothetical protein BRADI_2g34775v3 [Brachypodium distachyon]